MSVKPSANSQLSKIASYTEILAKDPKSTVFVPLAEAYRQLGMLDDALEVARKGVRAMPRFCPGYTVLGRIHAQRGELPRALEAFERALEIDGESLMALKGMARVLVQTGKKSRARELLQRAASLNPADDAVRKTLEALGGPASAASGGSGARPEAAPPAAASRSASGHRSFAEQDDHGLETVDPITTATIADIYIKQGFPRRAMKVYRDLLKADPHNTEIRSRLVALKRQLEVDEEAPGPPVPVESPAPAVAGGEAAPGRVEPVAAVVESRPAGPPPLSPTVFEAAAQVAAVPAAAPGAADIVAAQVAALSRWLDAIAMRRAHV